ncbi:MAG: hypothetical protein Q8867_08100, partial [Bacteroidota bacterium]|nr:hypothetical protein [Bacteroidota bacterium]
FCQNLGILGLLALIFLIMLSFTAFVHIVIRERKLNSHLRAFKRMVTKSNLINKTLYLLGLRIPINRMNNRGVPNPLTKNQRPKA